MESNNNPGLELANKILSGKYDSTLSIQDATDVVSVLRYFKSTSSDDEGEGETEIYDRAIDRQNKVVCTLILRKAEAKQSKDNMWSAFAKSATPMITELLLSEMGGGFGSNAPFPPTTEDIPTNPEDNVSPPPPQTQQPIDIDAVMSMFSKIIDGPSSDSLRPDSVLQPIDFNKILASVSKMFVPLSERET